MPDPTPNDPANQPNAPDPNAQNPATAGDPPNKPAPADPPVDGAADLGDAGKRALQIEREARAAMENQLKAMGLGDLIGTDLTALKQLANALGGKASGDTKTDLGRLTERIAELEGSTKIERRARWRAEVANEKQLTAEQASELQGKTREELAAHADRLKTLFTPAIDPNAPKVPKPDPSQGSRGPVDLDAQIAEAEKKGDVRASIRLKQEKARAARAATTR